jgi:predicted aspartyl protease
LNRRQALLTAAAVMASLPAVAAGRLIGRTPLDLDSGLIFVEGHLDGRPVEMLLDSGSAPTLIDIALARSLGFPLSGGGTAIGTAGGVTPVVRTGGFELRIGLAAVTFPVESVLALDLSGLTAGGKPVGVIAGQALFEAGPLGLDLPHARLLTGNTLPTDGFTRLPLTTEADGLRAVPVTIDGRPGVPATFDLGSAVPFQVTREWADAHGLLAGRRQSSWVATGIDGVSTYGTAILPSLQLGGFTLRNVPIGVTETQPQGASPAVVGLPVWWRFRLLADYAAASLWIAPDKGRLKAPFNHDRSGLAVQFKGEALEVVHVARASPAEAGGWTVGERIVAVDGRPVDPNWPGSRQSAWARQKAGTPVRLTLADGRQRDLVLADYY